MNNVESTKFIVPLNDNGAILKVKGEIMIDDRVEVLIKLYKSMFTFETYRIRDDLPKVEKRVNNYLSSVLDDGMEDNINITLVKDSVRRIFTKLKEGMN